MADWGGGDRGNRGQTGSKVGTWDAATRRARELAWIGGRADFGKAAAERLRNWAIADTGPGRLLPWLPVAFGLGIALYFAADREPAWWAGSALVLLCCALAVAVRRRPIAFPVALAFTAMAAGFTVAILKTARVAHPVLTRPAGNVAISGFVEVREERERTDRVVVRALSFEGQRLDQKLERVRVSVEKGHRAAGRLVCDLPRAAQPAARAAAARRL